MMVLWILFAYLALVTIYLTAITLASFFYRPVRSFFRASDLAVVIPAHDEEQGIAATVASIRACHYPRERLKIFVIADNCTDQTEREALAAGAMVFTRTDPDRRGKGYALDWFFRNHADFYRGAEAVCILDADVRLDPEFLSHMNRAFSDPHVTVVQGFNGVLNPGDTWRTSLTAAAFNVFNHLRPAGTSVLFGTGMLKGNGMAFRGDFLRRYGWPTHGLAEDLEMSIFLDRLNVPVHYQSSAIVTSEMTVSSTQASQQRNRWERARLLLAAKHLPRALAKGRVHIAFDLMTPPLSMLVAFQLAMAPLALVFQPVMAPFLGGVMMLTGVYVLSAQWQRGASPKQWRALLLSPLFIAWKVCLYLRWLVSRTRPTWTRTERNNNLC